MNLPSTIDILDSKIENCLIDEDQRAYLYDPYFEIVRNRVNAEYCKGLIRLDRKEEVVKKIINFLMHAQNEDGSWNEIHPYYDEPSSLVTSIVGDALIECYKRDKKDAVRETLESAKNYVLSCEIQPGYFIKSRNYRQDHLNVDATCADFLSSYNACFSDHETKKVAKAAVEHIREHQFKNGVFPYRVGNEDESSSMKVPCIHYQGVTIYYLIKALKNLGADDLTWLRRGTEWLSGVQKEDGAFDWSQSSLMFAYRLTGAYAFAYSSYNLSSMKERYSEKSKKCLEILNEHIDNLILRWEKTYGLDIVPSFVSVLKSSSRGENDFVDFLQKMFYGYYREVARRRFTKNPGDDMLFEKLNDILSLSSSTIEPSKNYPDLFMTTECFDCLTYIKYKI